MRSCRWAERPSPAARTAVFSGKDGTCPVKADKAQITRLLKTARGQIDGVLRMVDDDKYCIDILTQISASNSALKSVALLLLDDHLNHCVRQASIQGGEVADEKLAEASAAIARLVKS